MFSVKSIHLLEKRMLWQNGHQILPTQHGWKVRNEIHYKWTSNGKNMVVVCWVLCTCPSTYSPCLQGALLFYFFLISFWHNWIPWYFLPSSFEEADTCGSFSSRSLPHYIPFVGEQLLLCDAWNHALFTVNICFRSRWGDLWWRAQREFRLQHRFVIYVNSVFDSVF